MKRFHHLPLAGLALALGLAGCPAVTPTACQIGEVLYPGGAINPDDACLSCEPTLNSVGWSRLAGMDCDAGHTFDAGSPPDAGPPPGCTIAGVSYSDGDVNPKDPCELCRQASPTDWSNADEGASCGPIAGAVCLSNLCIGGCLVDGGAFMPGDTDPSGCLACIESQSRTTLTELPNGTPCAKTAASSICYGGDCVAGCFIDNTLYGTGAVNAQDLCQSCLPVVSTSAWTELPPGTACGTGMVCDASGKCGPFTGCTIGGVNYASGSSDPADLSQCCNPTTSAGAWIPRFQNIGTFALGGGATGIALADFNQDSLTDPAVAAPGVMFPDRALSVWLGQLDGGFGPSQSYSACGSWGIAAGDLDGDGFPDIIAGTCGIDGSINVLINQGDGTGSMLPASDEVFPEQVSGFAYPLKDLDNNGTLDLALAGKDAYFLEGHGDGTFADPVGYLYSGATQFTWVAAGRFLADGGTGFVIGDRTSDQLSLYLANTPGGFVAQTPLTAAGGTSGVAVGDFDGDGQLDIASGGTASSAPPSIYFGNGDGTFSQPKTYPRVSGGYLAVADLDRDGRDEALMASHSSFSVLWQLPDGGATATSHPTPAGIDCISAGDFNNDGAPDVAVCTGNGFTLFVNACP